MAFSTQQSFHCQRNYVALVAKGVLFTTAILIVTACSSPSEISEQSTSAATVVADVQTEAPVVEKNTRDRDITNHNIAAASSAPESDAEKTARNRRVSLISKLSDDPSPAEMEQSLAQVEVEFGEANTLYANQNFSESLYAQVVEEESYCLASGQCGDVTYLFKDAIMVGSVSDEAFGSTKIALIPHQPVSKARAVSYAQMLDINKAIDFETSKIEDNNEGSFAGQYEITETFSEANLPAENIAEYRGSVQLVQLSLVPNSNQVFGISFKVIVL